MAADANDPYKAFKFRVKWDGQYVAGVSKVGSLARGSQAAPRLSPGQSVYGPITLERGVTYDVAFEQWANKVWDYHDSTVQDQEGGAGNEDVSLKDFRKDVVIELYNEAGQKVLAYNVYRCWPSEFAALPGLDGGDSGTAIQISGESSMTYDAIVKECRCQTLIRA